MSLSLYLDDCAFSHQLRHLLRQAGHDVESPADVDPPITGADDPIHFAHAKATGRIILTLNPRDFKKKQRIHSQGEILVAQCLSLVSRSIPCTNSSAPC